MKVWDAISVHPYRQSGPETVEADWLRLRAMLERAAPGRNVPMISGEWGYSELYSGQSKARQAEYALRQYLVNLRCGVPISIWYDWKDDGVAPKEPEHHFGTVKPDPTPKPAFDTASAWSQKLAGYTFLTRLDTDDPQRWALLFRRGAQVRLAAWTTGKPSSVKIAGVQVAFGATPTLVSAPGLNALRGIMPRPWAIPDAARIDEQPGERWNLQLGVVQETYTFATQPMRLSILPERDGTVSAILENPYGRKISGGHFDGSSEKSVVLSLDRLTERTVFPLKRTLTEDITWVWAQASPRATDPIVSASVPRFVPLPLTNATASAGGDGKVRAAVSATSTDEGVRLDYDFDPGWRFAELHRAPTKVEGRPAAFGLWIRGNGSGDLLRMRYKDATGQTFQPDAGPIDWTGWRYVRFPLDGSGGHWGGANDGVIHPNVEITTLALVDMPAGRGGKGAVTVARPVFEYAR